MKLNKKTIHNLRDRVVTSSKQSTFYAIFSELRHNRKYLLATLITLAFAGYYFFNTVDNSSGIIDKRNALDTTNTSSINNSAITNNSNGSGITIGNNDEDKLDTSKYKGTYSVSVNLDSPIVLDEDRTINSYNLVYKIENDNVAPVVTPRKLELFVGTKSLNDYLKGGTENVDNETEGVVHDVASAYTKVSHDVAEDAVYYTREVRSSMNDIDSAI
jgi:hypothetical protein